MAGIEDDSVFRAFEERALKDPVPRREVESDKRTIYVPQELQEPEVVGAPVLCDFGSAMLMGDQSRTGFIQPTIYRAPEVLLMTPWTYSVDIWNVGCMV